jgi:hypothetical protein
MKYEREMLSAHGTELMVLKPSSLLGAARADFARKRRNVDRDFAAGGYEQYAFHRRHVRKAVDEMDLLIRALMDPVPGLESDKFNTRLIYGNAALLLSAIHLIRGEGLE